MKLREIIWTQNMGFVQEGLCQVCHAATVTYDTCHIVRYLPSNIYKGEHLNNLTVACTLCYSKYNSITGILKFMLDNGYLRNKDHQEMTNKLTSLISRQCTFHIGQGKYCQQHQIDFLKPYCKLHWSDQPMPMDTTW